jgi:anthranilate synthase component 1
MSHFPDFATFSRLAKDHQLIPVYRRLVSDTLTPVSAFHKIDSGDSACLFESVIGGEKVGRYSFLAAEPFMVLSASGSTVSVSDGEGTREYTAADPLEELRRLLSEPKAALLSELPPFGGGAVGYAGYDVVRYVEDLPNAPDDDRGLPDLSFAFYDRMIVFDNIDKTMYVVVTAQLDDESDLESAYHDATERVDATVGQLSQPEADLLCADIATGGEPSVTFQELVPRLGVTPATCPDQPGRRALLHGAIW